MEEMDQRKHVLKTTKMEQEKRFTLKAMYHRFGLHQSFGVKIVYRGRV